MTSLLDGQMSQTLPPVKTNPSFDEVMTRRVDKEDLIVILHKSYFNIQIAFFNEKILNFT